MIIFGSFFIFSSVSVLNYLNLCYIMVITFQMFAETFHMSTYSDMGLWCAETVIASVQNASQQRQRHRTEKTASIEQRKSERDSR